MDYHKDFAAVNEAYIPEFPKDVAMPCRTCVGIATLPGKHDIEMTIVSDPHSALIHLMYPHLRGGRMVRRMLTVDRC